MTEPTPETAPVPDMATLFCTDPLRLTHDNITEIITHMRAARHLFNTGAPKKKGTPKLTAKEAATKKLGLKLDLGDLKI